MKVSDEEINMKQKLLSELNIFLANEESSITTILNKCIQLSEEVYDENYRLLFTYHVNGIDKTETEELNKSNYQVYKMFFEDRIKSGEKFSLLGSILSLESSVRDYNRDIERAIQEIQRLRSSDPQNALNNKTSTISHSSKISFQSMLIGDLRTKRTQVEEIILRVRNRVAEFVRNQEKSAISQNNHMEEKIKNSNDQLNKKKIFVVHGRNSEARKALFIFLRSIGLEPLEWTEAVKATGKSSPYVGEVLDAAFSIAQAIIILMTPDDEARLLEKYRNEDDEYYELNLTPQARPNVIFEAGMAMGRDPDRTVIIELGKLRPFTDIGGRHVIRLNGSTQSRQSLAQRLETAGCEVNLIGTDWHTEGNFETVIKNLNEVEETVQSEKVDSTNPNVVKDSNNSETRNYKIQRLRELISQREELFSDGFAPVKKLYRFESSFNPRVEKFLADYFDDSYVKRFQKYGSSALEDFLKELLD